LENGEDHLAAGDDEALTEEREELRRMSLLGEDGADEGHAVGAEKGTAEVFESGNEVAAGGACVDGGLGELEGAEGGGGEVGFAGPAAVNGRFADAGGESDVIERHAGVTLFGEVTEGNFEDAALGIGVAGAAGRFFWGNRCNHGTMLTIYNDTIQYRIENIYSGEEEMRIGIIGSGNVGGTLGRRWAAGGHAVLFASRNPGSAEMRELAERAGNGARAVTAAEAAAGSEVVVLATPWGAAREALEGLDLAGKVVIDATNPLLPRLEGLEYGTTTSGAEQVAGWAPGARVVKAFNTVGYNVMADPEFDGARAVLFYCGDDGEAKAVAGGLAGELGFDARDAGPLRQARVLEPFALLWISLAMVHGYGREIGFQLLTRAGRGD
jgi:predicted dinucleotide-binding enzyme